MRLFAAVLNFSKRSHWTAALAVAVTALAGSVAWAGSAITVEPVANPAGVRISVQPPTNGGWALVQIVDPATGNVLKTVHAGRIRPRDSHVVVASDQLPAGSYKIRYRQGVELTLAGDVKRPDPKQPTWLNPTDLVLSGPWIYILDSGEKVETPTPEPTPEKLLKDACIFKMDRQGKPDPSFGEAGRLALPGLWGLNAFVVEPGSTRLILSHLGHQVNVYDPNGKPTEQIIGSWDGDPHGPKCTVWCNAIALGHGNRIYIPAPGYGNGKVYDRTKNGFDGIMYRFEIPDVNGIGRMICTDQKGAVYTSGSSNFITRYIDDGTTCKPAYKSDPELKLAKPTGGSASGDLTWWAAHGPGFGPYWDSGGGGEVVLFWDTGKELKLVDRYGIPGTAADKMQFLNPCAVIMDPTHNEVFILEDGTPNKEGPRGNARVRRFELKAKHSEEVTFELPR
jgi:hypothetical protein